MQVTARFGAGGIQVEPISSLPMWRLWALVMFVGGGAIC
jgi:hypothetical protein